MTARTPPVPPRYLGAAALALLCCSARGYWLGARATACEGAAGHSGRHRERTARGRAGVPRGTRHGAGLLHRHRHRARRWADWTRSRSPKGRTSRRARCWLQIDPRPFQAALEQCDRHPRQGRGAAGERAARHAALHAARPRGSRQQADRRHAARTHRAARGAGEGRRGAPSTTRAPSSTTPPLRSPIDGPHRHPPRRSGQHRARDRYGRHRGRDAARSRSRSFSRCPRSSSSS